MERLFETNASTPVLVGLGPAATHSKKWLALPGVVFSFFLQHAVHGWCPPVSVFRRMGFPTREEIDDENMHLRLCAEISKRLLNVAVSFQFPGPINV